MTKNKQLFLLVLFIIFSVLEIAGELFQNNWLTFIFKPLLIPSLYLVYFFQEKTVEKWIQIALLFSFLGDTLLLFSPQNELFFLLGLGAFLIAQSSYVYVFNKDRIKKRFPKKLIAFVLLFFLLGIGTLFYFILPTLGDFTIPVIIYATAVAAMGIFATLRFKSVSSSSYNFTLIGALLFIVSDTFIALDKFLFNENLAYASVIIMTLYILGQYLIVRGRTNLV